MLEPITLQVVHELHGTFGHDHIGDWGRCNRTSCERQDCQVHTSCRASTIEPVPMFPLACDSVGRRGEHAAAQQSEAGQYFSAGDRRVRSHSSVAILMGVTAWDTQQQMHASLAW